ncbi:MAG TPA: translation initiation factor IF-2 [Candidatus Acetothermia bacterium]|nr:translation initiation factor IF-2 [Candidatus Acetothermia bacterium]
MALSKKRVYEVARELGVPTKELIETLAEMGMPGLKAVNTVEEEEAEVIRELFEEHKGKTAAAQAPKEAEPAAAAPAKEKKPKTGVPRPPVVAVLGHIDHGKTTLLDTIRKTHVTQEEAGGITQSIGAYQAEVDGRLITFIDTPGHKAFTSMRARGAQVTDIAVLVVAADDGVMAQTLEAIDHIKAAGVPMIVAINKIDKPEANVDRVMQELAQIGYTPEDWGGDTITVPVSALTGQGVQDLLEMILLVAEMEDIRGDPKGELDATVIESHMDSARGPVATVIVKNGTLRERDIVVVGTTWGRIRALHDHQGKRLKEAGPGTPVQILGLEDVPPAGERVELVKKPNQAKALVEERRRAALEQRRVARPLMTFEDLLQAAERKKLVVVLKAESVGALDAARLELGTIEAEGVDLDVLHAGVGPITESDVLLAASVEDAQPLVVGFGVKVDSKARRAADERGIPVRTYDIIYDLTQDIERAMRRLLGPEYVEVKVGEAEVLKTFDIDGVGRVAGCVVRSGKVVRGARVKVLRLGEEVFAGEIGSLKRFARDVREVQAGRECGIRIRDHDDVQVGDVLEIYTLEEVQA